MKNRKPCKLAEFLNQAGILEHGTDEQIAALKKVYWSRYKRAWRKKQREQSKSYTIVLPHIEAKYLSEAARKHHRSPTNFLRESCFAYMDCRYLPVDSYALREIKQLLAMNYNLLLNLCNDAQVPYQTGNTLLQHMAQLERDVKVHLHNPITLEQWITKTVRETPQYKETLSVLLQTL